MRKRTRQKTNDPPPDTPGKAKRVAKRKNKKEANCEPELTENTSDVQDNSRFDLEELRAKKVVELRELLRDLGLKTGGRKEELVQRLYESLNPSADIETAPLPQQADTEQPNLTEPGANEPLSDDLLPQSIEPTDKETCNTEANDPDAILKSLEEELAREEEAARSELESTSRTGLSFPNPHVVATITTDNRSNTQILPPPRTNNFAIDCIIVAMLVLIFSAFGWETLLFPGSPAIIVTILVLLIRDRFGRKRSDDVVISDGIEMAQRLNEAEKVLSSLRDYRSRLAGLVERQRGEITVTQGQLLLHSSSTEGEADSSACVLLNQRVRGLRKARRENMMRLKEIDTQSAQLEHLIATKRLEEAFGLLQRIHSLPSSSSSGDTL